MKNIQLMVLVALVFIFQGCAGTVTSKVQESNKDSSFGFDGRYTATVEHPGGRQQLGAGWFNNCAARDFSSELSVKNSEVHWRFNNDAVAKGFINEAGKFRLEHLLDSKTRATSGVLSDGAITLILQGDLDGDVMKGLLVFGIAQFNNKGCSYPVTYTVS